MRFLGHIGDPRAGAARDSAAVDVNPAVSNRRDLRPRRIFSPSSVSAPGRWCRGIEQGVDEYAYEVRDGFRRTEVVGDRFIEQHL